MKNQNEVKTSKKLNKEEFIAALIKSGFNATCEHGVPTVVINTSDNMNDTYATVKNIANTLGYKESYGISCVHWKDFINEKY